MAKVLTSECFQRIDVVHVQMIFVKLSTNDLVFSISEFSILINYASFVRHSLKQIKLENS